MSNKPFLIYKHTSPSGKSYIGQTDNLNRRNKTHQSPNSGCINFKNAIQKYGWDSFTTEILSKNLTLEEANILEEQFIKKYTTLAPNGYNLTTGGLNCVLSEESKLKLRKPKTEAHKQKTSNTMKGRPARNKNKPTPEKTKQKISIANTGKTRSTETKQKMSDKRAGAPKSEKHKQNISLSKQGRKWKINPETGKRKYYFPV